MWDLIESVPDHCLSFSFHKQGCQILMKCGTHVAHMALQQEME